MRRNTFQSGLFMLYVVVGVVLSVVVLIWFRVDPASLELQLREHASIETGTVLLALGCCALSVAAASRSSRRLPWLVLAGLGLFTAGEDVTWGGAGSSLGGVHPCPRTVRRQCPRLL